MEQILSTQYGVRQFVVGDRYEQDDWKPVLPVPPRGCGILILQQLSHGDGSVCGWRIFAVPVGNHRIYGRDGGRKLKDDVVIGEKPFIYSFMDSNSDRHFILPKGTMEFGWNPRQEAKYFY